MTTRTDESRALLDAIEEPLLLVDDVRVVQANAAARALFGGDVAGTAVDALIALPEARPLLGSGGEGSIPLSGIGSDERREHKERSVSHQIETAGRCHRRTAALSRGSSNEKHGRD